RSSRRTRTAPRPSYGATSSTSTARWRRPFRTGGHRGRYHEAGTTRTSVLQPVAPGPIGQVWAVVSGDSAGERRIQHIRIQTKRSALDLVALTMASLTA